MEQSEKRNRNGRGTVDLWAGVPHAGCSSVAAPLRGCSLLTPRLQPKSLAAPSASIYEMASKQVCKTNEIMSQWKVRPHPGPLPRGEGERGGTLVKFVKHGSSHRCLPDW